MQRPTFWVCLDVSFCQFVHASANLCVGAQMSGGREGIQEVSSGGLVEPKGDTCCDLYPCGSELGQDRTRNQFHRSCSGDFRKTLFESGEFRRTLFRRKLVQIARLRSAAGLLTYVVVLHGYKLAGMLYVPLWNHQNVPGCCWCAIIEGCIMLILQHYYRCCALIASRPMHVIPRLHFPASLSHRERPHITGC